MRPIANPLLRGMYPDPSICRVGDTYYLANSTFEYLPGIPIHTSSDLQTWTLAGHAIHDPGQFDFSSVGDSRGMFAPTIRHHDGLFYVACTQMEAGEVSGNFYVTARDVAGPWSPPVMLPDARGIDPTIFFDDDHAWWIGCREVLHQRFDGETEVWMRELDLDRGELVGPETVIWTRTQRRAVWAEGPHLYRRGDWFYLLTAEGGTAFEHSVMIARSRSVRGPYEPFRSNPILTHRHLGHGAEVQNVGHGDLVEGEDGQWWMIMLASRVTDGHHILGRETHLARVVWEQDWPVVNPGQGLLDSPIAREGHWHSVGVPSPDDFLSVRGYGTFATSGEHGLALRSTGHGVESAHPTAALLRRLSSIDSTVSVTLDEVEADAAAGLVLRQSADHHARLELTRTGASLGADLVMRQGDDVVLASVALDDGPVTLTAAVSPAGVSWSVTTPGPTVELGRTPLEALSTETAGGFVGTTFGPFVGGRAGATALFTAWSQQDHS